MKFKYFLARNGVWIGFLILLVILTALTQGAFITPRNLTSLLKQTSINGVLAAGMTLVILHGGIDLSIGSVVALAGIMIGVSQVNWGWSELGASGAIYSSLLAIGVGLAAGTFTGGLIAYLQIAPFIITLGMMVITRGLALLISNGASISPMSESLTSVAIEYFPIAQSIAAVILVIGSFVYLTRIRWRQNILPIGTLLLLAYGFLAYRGFPVLAFFLVAVLAAVGFLLTHTVLGRSIYAIGSNERAAFWAGVPIRKVIWIVYAIMGALSGLAGVLLTARLNGADPNAGQLFELDAIAAVVIGGTSLKGGTGTILGSFVGALTIATLNNGMDLLSVPSFYQMIFKGLIIISAVALDRSQRR